MNACILQHAGPEHPGLIGDALAARGVHLEIVRVDRGDPVPQAIDPFDALVVMGGPMGVYETERYPHLVSEMGLIEEALRREIPVLGVCLGSQMLASVLGSPVAPAAREIGWRPVTLSPGAASDPLWTGVDRELFVFHWHGDAFDLPAGSRWLASSDRTPCQAFGYGGSAYGVLFHLEVDRAAIEGMLAAFPSDLEDEGIDPGDVMRHTERFLLGSRAAGAEVYGRWARLIERGPRER